MRDTCGRVIDYFGSWWIYIGWAMLVLSFLFMLASSLSVVAGVLCLIAILVWVIWTIIDIAGTYQPKWVIAVGVAWISVAILLPAFLGYGGGLLIMLWIAYVVQVRSD